MIVVVAVDMVGAGVIVIVGGFTGGFTVSAVPVLPDPSAGESSDWSTAIGVIGLRVGPTPSPSGTGLMVYHVLASSTAMYTQRRSSLMKWIGRYSLSLCEKM